MAFSINYATLFLLSALSIPLNFSRPRCWLLIIFGTRSECPRDAFSGQLFSDHKTPLKALAPSLYYIQQL